MDERSEERARNDAKVNELAPFLSDKDEVIEVIKGNVEKSLMLKFCNKNASNK